jgi:hypothetical protein
MKPFGQWFEMKLKCSTVPEHCIDIVWQAVEVVAIEARLWNLE